MTNTTNRLTEAQAAQMWDDLRDAFSNLEEKLIAIIQAKAWEPLGYESFAEAWTDRMQGFRLATDHMKAQVVYALLEDGKEQEEVLDLLGTQVSTQAVSDLAAQRDIGVPAEFATVRRHFRRLPGRPRFIRVELREDEFEDLRIVLSRKGQTVQQWATEILTKEAAKERRPKKVASF